NPDMVRRSPWDAPSHENPDMVRRSPWDAPVHLLERAHRRDHPRTGDADGLHARARNAAWGRRDEHRLAGIAPARPRGDRTDEVKHVTSEPRIPTSQRLRCESSTQIW